jgi:hypothetical protein
MRSFNIFYLSPNIIRHIKSKRMRWVGHPTWVTSFLLFVVVKRVTEYCEHEDL